MSKFLHNCSYCKCLNRKHCYCKHEYIKCSICLKEINSQSVFSLIVEIYENLKVAPWNSSPTFKVIDIKCITCYNDNK